MEFYKNEICIREYKYFDPSNRRRMLRIWLAEVKPNGEDEFYIIIKPQNEKY